MNNTKHNEEIEKIGAEVEAEYKMSGLSSGLYMDFATDVALRYAKRTQTKACIDMLDKFVESLGGFEDDDGEFITGKDDGDYIYFSAIREKLEALKLSMEEHANKE